jgi:hypothetical protein
MRTAVFLSTLVALGLLAVPAAAVDLTKIDRSIRKEPVYQSQNPQYCLLVFGPEAKTRVWLAVDGNVLYIDRNGNGDLTEPGERIAATREFPDLPDRSGVELLREFCLHCGVKDNRPTGEPVLSCVPDSVGVIVEQYVPAEREKAVPASFYRKYPFRVCVGTMLYSEDSTLAFASRPSEAPILHFDGPRRLALHHYTQPLRRGETSWLEVQLVTPGLDASTRTNSAEGMGSIHPVAEIECPPRRAGAEPIRFRLELPGRG